MTTPKNRAAEFASYRSHQASNLAYDLCKAIAQSCLLINGGAATAVIALLSKDKVDQALLTFIPWALGGYALGVAVSAYMLFCVMMSADHWNEFWYFLSYEVDERKAEREDNLGKKWQKRMNAGFLVAIFCFAFSCMVVAVGMSRVAPTVGSGASPAVQSQATSGVR